MSEITNEVSNNFPSIGDVKLTPNEQFNLPEGTTKYDLLFADGGEVLQGEHPLYWEILGGTDLTYQELILGTEGLMAYYPLYVDGKDISGKHLDMTVYGEVDFGSNSELMHSAALGYYASAPFDTSSTTTDNVMLVEQPMSTLCVELWCQFHFVADEYNGIFTFNAGITNDDRFQLSGRLTDEFSFLSPQVTNIFSLESSRMSKPTHVVCQYESDTGQTNLYFDGFLVSSMDGNQFSELIDGGKFLAGNFTTDGGGAYIRTYGNTQTSDCALYNRPLTPVEILQRSSFGKVYRPSMDSGSDLVPYRVAADKHTPSIGDVRPSNLEKYSEDHIDLFDYLLCDGSEVLESEHPLYYAYLREITPAFEVKNSSFEGSSSPWSFDTSYYTWSEGEIRVSTTSTYKKITQLLDVPMVDGKAYKVTVVCTAYTSGSLYVRRPRDGLVSDLDRAITGVGTFTWNIVATDSGGAEDLLNVTLATNDGTAGGGLGAKLTISSFTVEEVVPTGMRRPTNTSPYPNFPDRVVADLTEGDL